MELTTNNYHKYRPITSTVQRGRLSPKQQALLTAPNNHCLNLDNIAPLSSANLNQIFSHYNRSQPLIVDIGFGNGDQLLQLAKQCPDCNFIGIELYQKGIASLINGINQYELQNIKIINGNAAIALSNCFADASIDKLQLFFPDPWPKLRHHKRRLINNDFLNKLTKKLQVDGTLHIATDSRGYAEHILQHISNFPQFKRTINHDIWRPTTKFETIGVSLGHEIWDLVFTLQPL